MNTNQTNTDANANGIWTENYTHPSTQIALFINLQRAPPPR